ncbi:MAG: AAA family ATPase [Archaeoglobaceae archaeon]
MINSKVVNWRCIKNVNFELSDLNIFIGGNSTGKSSLAYALYFASKLATKGEDPKSILENLYGCSFDRVARFENSPRFPISVTIGESELLVESKNGELEIIKPSLSPWKDEYLLPYVRIGYLQLITSFREMLEQLATKKETIALYAAALLIFTKFFKPPNLPPLPLFMLDYLRAQGVELGPIRGEVTEVGSYVITLLPVLSAVMNIVARDPYICLELPPNLAPPGLLDFTIFDAMTRRIPKKSLVVIEEPEIHKNPLKIVDFTEKIVERTLEKELTLVITTHSDVPLLTIAKLVMDGRLKPKNVKIYYFKRSEENPWTTLSEIKILEDGTLEGWPDMEEVVSRLF